MNWFIPSVVTCSSVWIGSYRLLLLVVLCELVHTVCCYLLYFVDWFIPSVVTFSSVWIGLRMESTSGGTSEFHWGDCVTTLSITDSFESLTSFPDATACGYVSEDSIRLRRCDNTESMGFICENPNGELCY